MNCKNCKKQRCSLSGKNHEMSFECKSYVGKTTADRIRAMTDEELRLFFERLIMHCGSTYCHGCPLHDCCLDKGINDWLEQETMF